MRAEQQGRRGTCAALLINIHAILGRSRSRHAVARPGRLACAEQGVPTAGEVHLLSRMKGRQSLAEHANMLLHAPCHPLVTLVKELTQSLCDADAADAVSSAPLTGAAAQPPAAHCAVAGSPGARADASACITQAN